MRAFDLALALLELGDVDVVITESNSEYMTTHVWSIDGVSADGFLERGDIVDSYDDTFEDWEDVTDDVWEPHMPLNQDGALL